MPFFIVVDLAEKPLSNPDELLVEAIGYPTAEEAAVSARTRYPNMRFLIVEAEDVGSVLARALRRPVPSGLR